MTLPASGAISLGNIQTEFGGANPIGMNEYYRGGSYVTTNNTGVPTSGTITLNNFYNAVKEFSFTISSNTQNANLYTLAINAGWDGVIPVRATIASGYYLWSDSTGSPALVIPSNFSAGLVLVNNGFIMGRGGNGGTNGGGGGAGGPAIQNQSTNVNIVNQSGGYIGGGGGGGGGGPYNAGSATYTSGGGGGAGGGSGGTGFRAGTTDPGGAGGAIGAVGSKGSPDTISGAGGGSGSGAGFGPGAGGGRIMPGTGGAGYAGAGSGGSAGSAGTNGSGEAVSGGGGGGGWGASGGSGNGSGGAGGAAIYGTATTRSITGGAIYGSVV